MDSDINFRQILKENLSSTDQYSGYNLDGVLRSCKSKQQARRRKQFQILLEEKAEKAFNMLTSKLALTWEHLKNFNLEISLTK